MHLSRLRWAAMPLLLVACNASPQFDMAADEGMALESLEVESAAKSMAPAAPPASQAAVDRKLIRNGNVRLDVESVRPAIEAANGVAERAGGFIASSEVREADDGSRSASVTLRVPADTFDGVRAEIEGLGSVRSTSEQAQDVTQQYVDLETRVNVGTETVSRLLALLDRSCGLDDLLAVERELGRATADLEVLKGQLQYLENQVSLSTLHVEFLEPGALIGRGAWSPVGEAFSNAVRLFAESLGMVISAAVVFLPWLVVALVLWLFGRAIRRRMKSTAEVGAGVDA